MSTRPSYFVRSEGPDPESVKKAFSWLVKNSKPRGFLAVHGYGNLEGVIQDVIGDAAVKALRAGRLTISSAVIELVTERKLIYDARNSPLAAFYPNSRFLDQLDSIANISVMLVVPWNFAEVEPWIRARSAIELGAPVTEQTGPTLQSRVVERALESLTAVVNLSTGITDPRDRASAVQIFEILRNGGEPFTPEAVKTWLVSKEGWKATHAQEVAEVAKKVLEGRRLKSGTHRWRPDILKIWRAEAQKERNTHQGKIS
jgi:hypothetical protein